MDDIYVYLFFIFEWFIRMYWISLPFWFHLLDLIIGELRFCYSFLFVNTAAPDDCKDVIYFK